MRLFVGIPFSKETSDYLKGIQQKLPEAKMRLTRHIHITLQFLGEVQPEQVDEIKNHLSKISFKPLKLRLENLGVFKNKRGFIKVVWIGVSFPEELKKLQQDVEKELVTLGFPLDKPFSPHLTLARIKFTDDKKFEEEIKHIPIENREEEINEFILYRSHLGKEGPEYEELLKISV